jgi:shikimate dehydrogenase
MSDVPDYYGVIGHPIAHSWSPFIHGLFARQTGQHLVYRLHDVEPGEVRRFVARFFRQGGKGLNVTLPHKPAAAALADELTPRAAVAGAVNTLAAGADSRLLGDNTDGAGLVRDLEANLGVAIAGRRILMLGAGGAARGVVGPLLERAPLELVIANRTADRAREVAAVFAGRGPVHGRGFGELGEAPYDLLINATAASLHGEVPAVSPLLLGRHSVCYDMAYGHGDTAFMQFARAAGAARALAGWGMLVEQAAESFALWRGVRPDTGPVLQALQAQAAP